MQHVGVQQIQGAQPNNHPMHYNHAEVSNTNTPSNSTTSILRNYRKKDASEKLSPEASNPVESQGPVARVAPHAHYPKPISDIYKFPQHYGDYSMQNSSATPPVKYSEIIEPMQTIDHHLNHMIQKPKEKNYLDMCQQPHVKTYPDYNFGMRNMNPMPGYKQHFPINHHPYLQKESQISSTGYSQKDPNLAYMGNYKMQQYPRYPREGNEFLSNLNKIAPEMAQDILNDSHLREQQFPMYMEQNRMYAQQQQRMYQRTSPIHPNPNFNQRTQFNQYQMNQPRLQPENYRFYQSQPNLRYQQMEQIPNNISPRYENLYPPRISPNFNPCTPQLEYSQHYQHRQMPVRQDFLPIPGKPFLETHPEIPEIIPEEPIAPQGKSLKAYLENWSEETFTEEVENSDGIEKNPTKENTLYVLDAMDIPSENIPQYIHLQSIDKLPPNIRGFYTESGDLVSENRTQNPLLVPGNHMQKKEENIQKEIPEKLETHKTVMEERPACKLLQNIAFNSKAKHSFEDAFLKTNQSVHIPDQTPKSLPILVSDEENLPKTRDNLQDDGKNKFEVDPGQKHEDAIRRIDEDLEKNSGSVRDDENLHTIDANHNEGKVTIRKDDESFDGGEASLHSNRGNFRSNEENYLNLQLSENRIDRTKAKDATPKNLACKSNVEEIKKIEDCPKFDQSAKELPIKNENQLNLEEKISEHSQELSYGSNKDTMNADDASVCVNEDISKKSNNFYNENQNFKGFDRRNGNPFNVTDRHENVESNFNVNKNFTKNMRNEDQDCVRSAFTGSEDNIAVSLDESADSNLEEVKSVKSITGTQSLDDARSVFEAAKKMSKDITGQSEADEKNVIINKENEEVNEEKIRIILQEKLCSGTDEEKSKAYEEGSRIDEEIRERKEERSKLNRNIRITDPMRKNNGNLRNYDAFGKTNEDTYEEMSSKSEETFKKLPPSNKIEEPDSTIICLSDDLKDLHQESFEARPPPEHFPDLHKDLDVEIDEEIERIRNKKRRFSQLSNSELSAEEILGRKTVIAENTFEEINFSGGRFINQLQDDERSITKIVNDGIDDVCEDNERMNCPVDLSNAFEGDEKDSEIVTVEENSENSPEIIAALSPTLHLLKDGVGEDEINSKFQYNPGSDEEITKSDCEDMDITNEDIEDLERIANEGISENYEANCSRIREDFSDSEGDQNEEYSSCASSEYSDESSSEEMSDFLEDTHDRTMISKNYDFGNKELEDKNINLRDFEGSISKTLDFEGFKDFEDKVDDFERKGNNFLIKSDGFDYKLNESEDLAGNFEETAISSEEKASDFENEDNISENDDSSLMEHQEKRLEYFEETSKSPKNLGEDNEFHEESTNNDGETFVETSLQSAPTQENDEKLAKSLEDMKRKHANVTDVSKELNQEEVDTSSNNEDDFQESIEIEEINLEIVEEPTFDDMVLLQSQGDVEDSYPKEDTISNEEISSFREIELCPKDNNLCLKDAESFSKVENVSPEENGSNSKKNVLLNDENNCQNQEVFSNIEACNNVEAVPERIEENFTSIEDNLEETYLNLSEDVENSKPECSKTCALNSIPEISTEQDENSNENPEETGSFVLQIAKELLQINVSKDERGQKIIWVTPLTKVKVVANEEIVLQEEVLPETESADLQGVDINRNIIEPLAEEDADEINEIVFEEEEIEGKIDETIEETPLKFEDAEMIHFQGEIEENANVFDAEEEIAIEEKRKIGEIHEASVIIEKVDEILDEAEETRDDSLELQGTKEETEEIQKCSEESQKSVTEIRQISSEIALKDPQKKLIEDREGSINDSPPHLVAENNSWTKPIEEINLDVEVIVETSVEATGDETMPVLEPMIDCNEFEDQDPYDKVKKEKQLGDNCTNESIKEAKRGKILRKKMLKAELNQENETEKLKMGLNKKDKLKKKIDRGLELKKFVKSEKISKLLLRNKGQLKKKYLIVKKIKDSPSSSFIAEELSIRDGQRNHATIQKKLENKQKEIQSSKMPLNKKENSVNSIQISNRISKVKQIKKSLEEKQCNKKKSVENPTDLPKKRKEQSMLQNAHLIPNLSSSEDLPKKTKEDLKKKEEDEISKSTKYKMTNYKIPKKEAESKKLTELRRFRRIKASKDDGDKRTRPIVKSISLNRKETKILEKNSTVELISCNKEENIVLENENLLGIKEKSLREESLKNENVIQKIELVQTLKNKVGIVKMDENIAEENLKTSHDKRIRIESIASKLEEKIHDEDLKKCLKKKVQFNLESQEIEESNITKTNQDKTNCDIKSCLKNSHNKEEVTPLNGMKKQFSSLKLIPTLKRSFSCNIAEDTDENNKRRRLSLQEYNIRKKKHLCEKAEENKLQHGLLVEGLDFEGAKLQEEIEEEVLRNLTSPSHNNEESIEENVLVNSSNASNVENFEADDEKSSAVLKVFERSDFEDDEDVIHNLELSENEEKPRTVDKSVVEEKLNSLEEFLPKVSKISSRRPTSEDISQKLEDLFAERPIYEQRNYDMVLVNRFLNHDTLTFEEMKKVRDVVSRKKYLLRKSSEAVKKRLNCEVNSKSVSIDFSDFDFKKPAFEEKFDCFEEKRTEEMTEKEENIKVISYNKSITKYLQQTKMNDSRNVFISSKKTMEEFEETRQNKNDFEHTHIFYDRQHAHPATVGNEDRTPAPNADTRSITFRQEFEDNQKRIAENQRKIDENRRKLEKNLRKFEGAHNFESNPNSEVSSTGILSSVISKTKAQLKLFEDDSKDRTFNQVLSSENVHEKNVEESSPTRGTFEREELFKGGEEMIKFEEDAKCKVMASVTEMESKRVEESKDFAEGNFGKCKLSRTETETNHPKDKNGEAVKKLAVCEVDKANFVSRTKLFHKQQTDKFEEFVDSVSSTTEIDERRVDDVYQSIDQSIKWDRNDMIEENPSTVSNEENGGFKLEVHKFKEGKNQSGKPSVKLIEKDDKFDVTSSVRLEEGKNENETIQESDQLSSNSIEINLDSIEFKPNLVEVKRSNSVHFQTDFKATNTTQPISIDIQSNQLDPIQQPNPCPKKHLTSKSLTQENPLQTNSFENVPRVTDVCKKTLKTGAQSKIQDQKIAKMNAIIQIYKRTLEVPNNRETVKKMEDLIEKLTQGNLKKIQRAINPSLLNKYKHPRSNHKLHPTKPNPNGSIATHLSSTSSIPDSTTNVYEIARTQCPSTQDEIKIHLKKVPGERKKRRKRFRNLYTADDSDDDAQPRAKECKFNDSRTTATAVDYSVFQRSSPKGVPKLVIKVKKSECRDSLQPYIKLARMPSLENMVKHKKRTLLLN